MSHARVEEISDSDSDPDIDDPTDFLPDSDNSIIVPANIPPPISSARAVPSTNYPRPPPAPSAFSQQQATTLRPQGPAAIKQSREAVKHWCAIYPVYFDRARTRSSGRRVSSSLAIANPLAHTVAMAVQTILGAHAIPTAFEPDKTHPKDWSNPGRVRVQLFDKETHTALHPTIQTKSHLFVLVAKYLQTHPTTSDDPLKLQVQGLTVPADGAIKPPAVPRGWKINSILPLHSPAMTGGGVSDNFFKEAMEELRLAQATEGGGGGGGGSGGGMGLPQLPPGMMGGGGGGGEAVGKKKKDKKKG